MKNDNNNNNRRVHHGLQRDDERSLCSSIDDGLDAFERSDDESGKDFCFPPQRVNHSLTIE